MQNLFVIRGVKENKVVRLYRDDLAEAFRARDSMEAVGWMARVSYNRTALAATRPGVGKKARS